MRKFPHCTYKGIRAFDFGLPNFCQFPMRPPIYHRFQIWCDLAFRISEFPNFCECSSRRAHALGGAIPSGSEAPDIWTARRICGKCEDPHSTYAAISVNGGQFGDIGFLTAPIAPSDLESMSEKLRFRAAHFRISSKVLFGAPLRWMARWRRSVKFYLDDRRLLFAECADPHCSSTAQIGLWAGRFRDAECLPSSTAPPTPARSIVDVRRGAIFRPKFSNFQISAKVLRVGNSLWLARFCRGAMFSLDGPRAGYLGNAQLPRCTCAAQICRWGGWFWDFGFLPMPNGPQI